MVRMVRMVRLLAKTKCHACLPSLNTHTNHLACHRAYVSFAFFIFIFTPANRVGV